MQYATVSYCMLNPHINIICYVLLITSVVYCSIQNTAVYSILHYIVYCRYIAGSCWAGEVTNFNRMLWYTLG